MGFLSTIKKWFGIGGAKVQLTTPNSLAKDAKTTNGSFTITTKSEVTITKMEVIFEEKYTKGSGDNKTVKEFEWGKTEWNETFVLKAGETKTVDFTLSFDRPLSSTQAMADKGGVVGGIGKAASFLSSEKSEYFVKVDLDVKGAVLDPSDSVQVSFK
jgi:sporulation-control protein spo0M